MITSPAFAGATSVSGTSLAPNGSTISLYVNGGSTPIGTASVDNTGHWNVTSLSAPLADGDTLTATVTVGGTTSGPSAPVAVSANAADVTPAPVVTSPILSGATSVGGTSVSPAGTRIDVFVNGTYAGTTSVGSNNTWTLNGLTALAAGQAVTATATDSANLHGTSAPSAPVYVSANVANQTPAPVVLGPIYDNASMVYGTSPSPAGTLIAVYASGAFLGQTTVQAGGTWSLSGIGPLATLQAITATATDLANSYGTSSPSAPVIVEPSGANPPTPAPTVNSPINAGATSVSGTSPSPSGTTIKVFVDSTFAGTTTVLANGTWTLTVGTALAAGQAITATATDSANFLAESGPSAPVYVSGAGGTTPAPAVDSPINAGATSVSGTSTAAVGSRIDVFVNGTYAGTTSVGSGGVWILNGLTALAAGQVVTATATETGKGTSAPSSPVTVSLVSVNLLRYGGVTALSPLAPAASTIFTGYPGDPSIPASDWVVQGYTSASSFPQETSDLQGTSPALVFYQLQGNTGSTLRVTKVSGKIVISY